MGQVPLERDINIAVNGCSGFATSTQKGPFMAMLISRSGSTYLIVLETCCAIPRATPLQDLREAFRIFDKDRSGYIDSKEIIAVTTTLGQALTKEELEQFMAEADLDGDGKLNYEEFVKVMTKDWD